MPSIAVLVKHVPDTWSVKSLESDFTLDRANADLVIDEVNEYAVEQAMRIKEAHGDDWRVIAVTMGEANADESLRKALSMGVDDAIRLTDDALAGSDAIATAWALSNLLNTIGDLQLIVMGRTSSDGDTGLVSGLLAEYRAIPALTALSAVSVTDNTVSGTRVDHRGQWELQAPLPAIVSVTDKADAPRFPNFKMLRAAKEHEITVYDLAAIGVDPAQVGLNNSATRVLSAHPVPARTSGETINAIADPEAAAVKIADFIAERNLI